VLMFLIHLMDHAVEKDYCLVYVHTLSAYANQPPLTFIRQCYNVLQRKSAKKICFLRFRYKKNLKRLYIVHPSWTVKTILFFARAFVSPKFWQKVRRHERTCS
jgi:hypothetical protein